MMISVFDNLLGNEYNTQRYYSFFEQRSTVVAKEKNKSGGRDDDGGGGRLDTSLFPASGLFFWSVSESSQNPLVGWLAAVGSWSVHGQT